MGVRLPASSNGSLRKLTTDDLDFFLLDIVSETGIGLPAFDKPRLGELVNCHVPDHTRPELIAALAELFRRGDVAADVKSPSGRSYRNLRLNSHEIEACIAGAIRACYFLTPQGGERWAQHARIDWQCWDGDSWSTSNSGQITTGSPELTEFLFEREVRSGKTQGPGRWREVRPWKATYWHEEQAGYQVRYRLKQGTDDLDLDTSLYPSAWQELLPRPGAHPAGLIARRPRNTAEASQPAQPLNERQIEKRFEHRFPLRRLAVEREFTRQAGTDQLIRSLEIACPISRYCAAEELGGRKSAEAVPALIGAVFNQHDVAALDALGGIGDERALEPLLVLLECWRGHSFCHEPQFLAALERTILQFGDAAIARIEELARTSRIGLERAFFALERSTSPRAAQFMARQMREHSCSVMEIMGRMGAEARALLFEVASGTHESKHRRTLATAALMRTEGPYRREASRLSDAIKEDRLRVQIAYFVTGGTSNAVADPVEALIPFLRHSRCARRRTAVDLLAELNAKEASDEIAQLVNDELWPVRASVARALLRWGGPQRAIARLRRDPDIIVRGCATWFREPGAD